MERFAFVFFAAYLLLGLVLIVSDDFDSIGDSLGISGAVVFSARFNSARFRASSCCFFSASISPTAFILIFPIFYKVINYEC